LQKILTFIRSQKEVDNSNLGVLGQSFGTSVLVALSPNVKCIVLTGSIHNPKEVLANYIGEGYNPEGISIKKRSNGTITKIRPDFWKDLESFDLLKSIKNTKCPILFINGADDEMTISQVETYFKNANNLKQKIIIEKADHSFTLNRERLYKEVYNWFSRYLVSEIYAKIIVVDEKDGMIGSKEREAVEMSDIYRVSALWITNSRSEILLARRALTKSHSPGKWGPAVAGTIEEGETYGTNIIKEAEEEIGLINIKPDKGTKIRISNKYNYFLQWYTVKIDKQLEKFEIQKSEVAEIRWFSKDEIKKKINENPDEFINSVKQWIGLFI